MITVGAGLPKSGKFRFFDHKVVCCGFSKKNASSSTSIACIAATQHCRSGIRTNTPCGVRYVTCHAQVALLLSFLGPPWCQWCSDCYGLYCSAAVAFGCVCLSHVSGWLRLVEVFAVLPVGASCFFCVSGPEATFGYRRPPRHARTARVLEVRSCTCSCQEINFFVVFKLSERSW